MSKFMRGTTATKKTKDGLIVNIEYLAMTYENWGNVPKYVGALRAGEIALLAKAYLAYRDRDKNKYPRKAVT